MPVGALARLTAAFFALFVSMAIMSPTLDALVRHPFDLNNEETSRFMQSSAAAGLIAGLVMGWLADWWGRRVPMLVAAMVASGVLTALFPHMGDYDNLLSLRFVEGFVGATALMLIMARAVDLSTAATRPRVMAVLMSAVPLGYLAGQPLVGLLGPISLSLLFGTTGATLVAAGLMMAWDWRTERATQRPTIGLRDLGATLVQLPRAWLPMMVGATDKFTVAAIAVATPLVLKDRFGLEPLTWTPILMAVYWLAFLATNWPAGKLAAAWGLRPTLLWTLIPYGAALAAFPHVGLAGAVITMAVLGVLTSFQFVPSLSLLGECAQPHQRATFMAFNNLLGSVGLIVGFAVVGRLSDTSYELAYAATGLVAILVGAFGILIAGITDGIQTWRQNAGANLRDPGLMSLNADATDLGLGK